MIKEQARVVAIENDAVWVETHRRSTCQSCALQKGCGHGVLSGMGGRRPHHIRVLPGAFLSSQVRVDDRVEISIPERFLVGGALLVYLLPLLTLLSGASLAVYGARDMIQNQDISALIGAVLGLTVGILLVKGHSVFTHRPSAYQPVVVSVNGISEPDMIKILAS